jgi:hypothetical protein
MEGEVKAAVEKVFIHRVMLQGKAIEKIKKDRI